MNYYKPTMWGYVPRFYRIILRNPFVNPITRVKFFYNRERPNILDNSDYTYKAFMYIQNLDRLPSNRIIKLLWGLLNKKERENFINNTFREINHTYDLD